MGARIKSEGEAAWRTVVRRNLPNDVSWGGFCREMGWPGSCPMKVRTGDNHRLDFYIRAALILGMHPPAFIADVLAEMEKRKAEVPPAME